MLQCRLTRLFMRLLQIYCLPENYEVFDKYLDDIKVRKTKKYAFKVFMFYQNVVKPTFTAEDIQRLDTCSKQVLDLSKKSYLPGYVGLNNIKANDYVNTCFQALAHIGPLRNFFLLSDNLTAYASLGNQRFNIFYFTFISLFYISQDVWRIDEKNLEQ